MEYIMEYIMEYTRERDVKDAPLQREGVVTRARAFGSMNGLGSV